MRYTKQDVQQKTKTIRARYAKGKLTTAEIAQYESLPGWIWSREERLPFEEARDLARAQHFTSQREFSKWEKPKGMGMPSNPYRTYKSSGWKGWGDFLGTGNTRQASFMSFTKARSLARAQHFTSQREFYKWEQPGMPGRPDRTYKSSGWKGWGDFLGTGNTRQTSFMSFTKARSLARAQHFTSQKEFYKWEKPKGMGMPSQPYETYKSSGWKGWGDFLGTGNTRQTSFMSFTKARSLARAQHFTSQREFHKWEKPKGMQGMPGNPYKTYKSSGWTDWYDFLGRRNK